MSHQGNKLFCLPDNNLPERQINLFMGCDCHIETLFGALKSRGFNLEDTKLQDSEGLSRLLALLAPAFTWAFVVGLWQASRTKTEETRLSASCVV